MKTYNDDFPYIFSKEREEAILADMEAIKEEVMATQGIRKLSKAKQEKFIAKFCKWLEEQGGVRIRPEFHDYALDSISGRLSVYIPSSQMYGYEVFCRFTEVNEAAARLYVNPNTGKWNHYIRDVGMSVDDAIAQMINWIEPVLLKEQNND